MSSFAYDSDLLFGPQTYEQDLLSATTRSAALDSLPFIEEKLRIPRFDGLIERPRIEAMLENASERFVANLISGRAQTGKTATAAAYAEKYRRVAWYTLDAADNSWHIFSRYFARSVVSAARTPSGGLAPAEVRIPEAEDVADFLVKLLPQTYSSDIGEPLLVVLDDLHHVFDAHWFEDFFNLLLFSLPSSVHLLMLCRGKPPLPLWRLRSKQLLNVIDEKTLAFDRAETEQLYKKLGVSRAAAGRAHESSFGCAGKLALLAAAEKRTNNNSKKRSRI